MANPNPDLEALAEARNEVWSHRERGTPLRTYSGKIVYKKAKRYWTRKDAERILASVSEEKDEDFPWWLKLINWAADQMLGRIFGALGIDDELATSVWSFIMYFWERMMAKITSDPYMLEYSKLFWDRYKTAIRAYLNGNPDLFKRIIDDLLGGTDGN